MKKLCDLVDIRANNEECVVLTVKKNVELDLIELGCFNGDEEILRITKGDNHTITVFTKDGINYSWNCRTLVVQSMSKRRKLIQECVEEDFGIYIGKDKIKIQNTLNITKLEDQKGTPHILKLMWWKDSKHLEVTMHYDGEFYKNFKGYDLAKEYMEKNYSNINIIKEYIASTGCYVEEYYITRK